MQAFSQFGNNKSVPFNAGEDRDWQWGSQGMGSNVRGCFAGSEDDLRLTVEGNGNVNIYNSSGDLVMANVSSVTIGVPVATSGTGHLTGTLKFPSVVDLRSDPITIVLQGACGQNGCSGNFAMIGDDESPDSEYTYDIQISTFQLKDGGGTEPAHYWMQILSNYWGRIQENNDRSDVTFKDGGPTTITKDMKFAPAGKVTGKVYKPDGSLFQPGQSENGQKIS